MICHQVAYKLKHRTHLLVPEPRPKWTRCDHIDTILITVPQLPHTTSLHFVILYYGPGNCNQISIVLQLFCKNDVMAV